MLRHGRWLASPQPRPSLLGPSRVRAAQVKAREKAERAYADAVDRKKCVVSFFLRLGSSGDATSNVQNTYVHCRKRKVLFWKSTCRWWKCSRTAEIKDIGIVRERKRAGLRGVTASALERLKKAQDEARKKEAYSSQRLVRLRFFSSSTALRRGPLYYP